MVLQKTVLWNMPTRWRSTESTTPSSPSQTASPSTSTTTPPKQNAQGADKVKKQPISKRIGEYFKRLGNDYKAAVVETGTVIKTKPIRSTFFLTATSGLAYLYVTNPSFKDYEARLAEMTADLAECGSLILNEDKSDQVHKLVQHHNTGCLKRFTLGVVSFIYVDNHPAFVKNYEAQCKQVGMTWLDFPNHIVDIGASNRWFWSEEMMKDFDVNPEEWRHLEVGKPTQ